MVKLKKGKSVSSPSSAIGIMKFNETDSKIPTLTPEFVILVLLFIIATVLAIKHLF